MEAELVAFKLRDGRKLESSRCFYSGRVAANYSAKTHSLISFRSQKKFKDLDQTTAPKFSLLHKNVYSSVINLMEGQFLCNN